MGKRSQFVLRLLPSFTDFAFLMPIAYLFGVLGGSRSLLNDCDTGWHIRTGEWILANARIPAIDIFSFSMPGAPWFAWEWLSDILFAKLNAADGLRAVVLFTVLLLCGIFTLLYLLARRNSNAIVAILVTMVAAAASSIHWLARPHMFTLLFLVLFYGALERIREGRPKLGGVPYLAIFPLVTILWTNLHSGFLVGIVMISAYGAGEFLDFLFSADPGRRAAAWRNARGYFLSAAGCLAASLINPYTYHLHVHMIRYLADPWNSQHIVEFLSPSFHQSRALFFEMFLAPAVAAAWWCASKRRYVEPVLIVLWAHASLLANRNIPIFVIVAAPIIAAALQHWLTQTAESGVAAWARQVVARFNRIVAQTEEKESVGRFHLVSAAGFALLAAVFFAPHPPVKFRAEFDPTRYPAAALAAVRPEAGARIFTDDEWGDYLIWRLYPKNRVFVDGRSDFYGDEFEEQFGDVLHVRHGWDKILSRFGVNTVLMPVDTALSGALKESSHWRLVYDDGMALVFRSNIDAVETVSTPLPGAGPSRDREITKTEASDRLITVTKSKT